ncbi:MAG: DUF302 domain-containing protein [Gammaproteobacteria bacterium]
MMICKFKRIMVAVAALVTLSACSTQPQGEFIPYYQVSTAKPYDDVIAELEAAIAENNFRITGHSRVGKVIRERENIDFPDYDTVQFCNLTLAKKILLMSPQAIRFMPCNVVTYAADGKVVISTHLLPEDSGNAELDVFAVQMNRILKTIVDFAAEE